MHDITESQPPAQPAIAATCAKGPANLLLELIEWEGRPHCMYLQDYRIVGAKPWAGGTSIYSWSVKIGQLNEILDAAHDREATELVCEVYRHADGNCSVYLDNVLLVSRNKRDSRERQVGSVLILRKLAFVRDFPRAHSSLAMPEPVQAE